FGVGGAQGGEVGVNYAVLPDGTRVDLRGHDEIDLPAEGMFVLKTPGGGGFS
ncbi:MAG: 5-oxoprolinase (ATP-hydrolyzing), partial [Celeribacter sp.]